MVRSVLFLLLATSVAAGAEPKAERAPKAATTADKKAPRKAGPDDKKAVELLEKIERGTGAARKSAIEDLNVLAPNAVDAIGEWLMRSHQVSADDRRAVLRSIDAQVPDKSGKFAVPNRQTSKEAKADDNLDWLPKLQGLPLTPGVGEVVADVAAIRALAQSKDWRAAQPIFDAAFHDETMLYRDECGRYLRKMEPYVIPVLTKESARGTERKRYATYQLERIDRQEPNKAFAAAAGDEALTVEILRVFKQTKIREAVHAVWGKVNDDRPRVRAAARETWMDYITGPPPPAAPKKKLQMPGGKLTKKEKPLWLTYRELADNELRQSANDLLGEDYPLEDPTSIGDDDRPTNTVKIDLVQTTKRLFDHFDAARAKVDGAAWAAAKAKADGGDLAAATAALDRLIAQNPNRAEREGMATIYFAWGKQLEEKRQYADAAAAYSKAHGLDPKGAKANDALAAHFFNLGKSLEASGKDGGPDFRRAMVLKPDYAPAEEAAKTALSGPGKRPTWMLVSAVIAGLVAALLFAVAMLRRRRV